MTRLRVLLSEASSLTAREHLTVLGTAGGAGGGDEQRPVRLVPLEPLGPAAAPLPCLRHVLLRFGRRGTGPGVLLDARLWALKARGQLPICWPPARPGLVVSWG